MLGAMQELQYLSYIRTYTLVGATILSNCMVTVCMQYINTGQWHETIHAYIHAVSGNVKLSREVLLSVVTERQWLISYVSLVMSVSLTLSFLPEWPPALSCGWHPGHEGISDGKCSLSSPPAFDWQQIQNALGAVSGRSESEEWGKGGEKWRGK